MSYTSLRTMPLVPLTSLLFCAPLSSLATAAESGDPPEVTIGERLFLETRFAQFFFAHGNGGDPVVEHTITTGAPLPGPFAGQAVNCRACHLVDEQVDAVGGGIRTYNDFARRSPVPLRSEDQAETAVRNAPPLVNSALTRSGGPLFHFDGEFATLEDLVQGTLTGRNFGWLPHEHAVAVAHIAQVIRGDDGSGALAQEFGGPYRVVLHGVAPEIPAELLLPQQFRIDVEHASDQQIVDGVSRLVAAYVESLVFAQDPQGRFNGSPYDAFLAKNGLPRAPRAGESSAEYSRRLAAAVAQLSDPQWVTVADGSFASHEQAFAFGPTELAGLRMFFRQPEARSPSSATAGVGNCVACHPAPAFTDFGLHNTGATQLEYDEVHGIGAFATLAIPDFADRNAHPATFLPATPRHPQAAEPFRRIATSGVPMYTDLGVWNIVANPDFPSPQSRLHQILCQARRSEHLLIVRHGQAPQQPGRGNHRPSCAPRDLLNASIARFKTPGLRDLAHSAPFLHDGSRNRLREILDFYRDVATLQRTGKLRNGAPELGDIQLGATDTNALLAFLQSLNEDYE